MQQASLENYIKVVNQCKELFDSGKIAEDILEWAVIPNFSNRHLLVRNFENANVKRFLIDMQYDKRISLRFKENIGNILSGTLWNNIKESEGN